MKDLKTLIAEAKRNAPPLNFTNKSEHKNVVLIEESINPLVAKLNKHLANLDSRLNHKDEPKDWQNLKHDMIMNLEAKRKEKWEHQKEVHKMNEDEEELEELDDEVDRDYSDSESDSQSQIEFKDAPEVETEVDKILGGDEEGEDDCKQELEANNSQEDEEESVKDELEENEHKSNDDNKEEIDDESVTRSSKSKVILDSDDEENFEISSIRKPKVIEDEEDFNDNAMGFNSQGSWQEDKKIDFKSTIYCQGSEAIFNAESGDSNDLLQFCSGQFNTQKFIESQVEPSEESNSLSIKNLESNTVSESINEDDNDEDIVDGYQSDVEDYPEEREGFYGEEVEDDEDQATEKSVKRTKFRMTDFVEEEAELSGSEADVSSDESDNEDNEYEADEIQEDLPSDDEIRHQVERIYKKQELDEDKRQLILLQERYLQDGDLHDENNRVRKFKWNFQNDDDNEFTNILTDSENEAQDSDDDDFESGQMIQFKRPVMKDSEDVIDEYKEEFTTIERLDSQDGIIETISSKSQSSTNSNSRVTFSQALESTSLFRNKFLQQKKTKITKLTSFFVKDDRLKSLLNKRPNKNSNNNGAGPSKRARIDEDSSSKSIFDLL